MKDTEKFKYVMRKLKQRQIINDLDVHRIRDHQDKDVYIQQTIAWIRNITEQYVKKAHAKGVVLGLSGGLDSFVVAAILAGIQNDDFQLSLLAIPNGIQEDFDDVMECYNVIKAINPKVTLKATNIFNATKSVRNILRFNEYDVTDTAKGNIAARLRMIMQYAVANNQLVVGTDHATEAVVGYYTKYGDGGSDFNPIGGLLKTDLYKIAEHLNAPKCVLEKRPSAGLGITSCDEEELGLSYNDDIVPFLNGKNINIEKADNIIRRYDATQHKREMPFNAYGYKSFKDRVTHVVIDCCHDFIGGTLACKNATTAVYNIIEQINENPDQNVLYVQETHPANHCSFKSEGGNWPPHCVEGTKGAELSPILYTGIFKDTNTPIEDFNVFKKGGNPNVEEYSGFNAFSPDQGFLHDNCEETVFISGIATEYCVLNTVKDFISNGFNVIIKENCLAYVDKEEHYKTLAEFIRLGVTVIYN